MARDGSGAPRRAVTAFFDERSQAQAAIDDLLAAGVGRDRITLLEGGPGLKTDPVEPSSEKGFLAAVRELFMADEDHHAYGEGLRRGGFLLSVMVEGDGARVVEVLDREGAVDMDARQSDWELEGWDPVRASADLRGAALAELRPAAEPAPGRDAPAAAPSPTAEEVRAALEPAGAVGPAFAAGRTPAARAGRAVRDTEAEGLRLRSYVESHDHPDAMR